MHCNPFSGKPLAMRNNMAKAREKAGLSQAALAVKVGAAQSTIARIESGESTPNANLGLKISEALGIGLVDLLALHEESEESAEVHQ